MHTLLILLGFCIIVFAPVIAAQASRAKRRRKTEKTFSNIHIVDPLPPRANHHLRPRPRDRKFF
jgi:uncharacterized membrane protein